jgi:aldehyde dehydrogenase (NAD+)
MLVPSARLDEAAAIAREAAEQIVVGDPRENVGMGPLSSRAQFDKVQGYIAKGIEQGAVLVTGGPGRPSGIDRGYYARPTVFSRVTPDMAIAREEIFGPVLAILGYDSIEQAIAIANDTEYGLAAYVHGQDLEQARRVAAGIRAGQVAINEAFDMTVPFGGYKKSGNGREWGARGLEEFLETKAILGFASA